MRIVIIDSGYSYLTVQYNKVVLIIFRKVSLKHYNTTL